MPTVILTILLSAHLLRQFTCTMATTQALEGYIVDDRYTVCKRLQSGFYGATWLATDARNDYQDVCLKVYYKTMKVVNYSYSTVRYQKLRTYVYVYMCLYYLI